MLNFKDIFAICQKSAIFVAHLIILISFVMYQLERINSLYNYDENVIVTEMFIFDVDNVDDVFKKRFANDKSTAEMKAVTTKWSLTTLSIFTGKTPEDLKKQFGQSFKRCYVRPLSTALCFNVVTMSIETTSSVEISLNSRFANSHLFTISNETPLTEEFIKNLQNPSKVGYDPCKFVNNV